MNPLKPLYRLADSLRYRKSADLGRFGEDLAHRYLRSRRFVIVARNWRPPQGGGEIDIIAWESDWLVFVEVKTRSGSALNAPERDIDPEKIKYLRRAARDYVRRANADPTKVRFDAVTISGAKIDHFRDAFSPG